MSASPADRRQATPIQQWLVDVDAPGLVSVGMLTFVVGYVVTAIVIFVGPSETGEDMLRVLMTIGIIYYSAHQVPAIGANGEPFDFLAFVAQPTTPAPEVPVIVFYAIPALLLLGGSVLAVRRFTSNPLVPRQLFLGIGLFAVGYAIMALVGAFGVSASIRGSVASPAVGSALLFGLIYPIVFGGLGAGLVNIAEGYREVRTG